MIYLTRLLPIISWLLILHCFVWGVHVWGGCVYACLEVKGQTQVSFLRWCLTCFWGRVSYWNSLLTLARRPQGLICLHHPSSGIISAGGHTQLLHRARVFMQNFYAYSTSIFSTGPSPWILIFYCMSKPAMCFFGDSSCILSISEKPQGTGVRNWKQLHQWSLRVCSPDWTGEETGHRAQRHCPAGAEE